MQRDLHAKVLGIPHLPQQANVECRPDCPRGGLNLASSHERPSLTKHEASYLSYNRQIAKIQQTHGLRFRTKLTVDDRGCSWLLDEKEVRHGVVPCLLARLCATYPPCQAPQVGGSCLFDAPMLVLRLFRHLSYLSSPQPPTSSTPPHTPTASHTAVYPSSHHMLLPPAFYPTTPCESSQPPRCSTPASHLISEPARPTASFPLITFPSDPSRLQPHCHTRR